MKINESINLMKALGDASRLLIVNSLMEKPHYLEELAKKLNLSESTVSFHMKKLENSGLVYRKKEQYYAIFSINQEVINSTLKDIISFDNIQKPVQDERIRDYRNKVIGVYFREGKLLRIPSQHKKRQIILEEIIMLFEKDRVYPEKEVDSILEEVNEDYCSIRRYFIDKNMMKRDWGSYRVNPEYINNSGDTIPAFKHVPEMQKADIKPSSPGKGNSMDSAKRKEIINNYKQTRATMGVYQLKNLKNGKIFIGSGKNLEAKRNMHMFALKNWGLHEIVELQEAWNELGDKGVAFEILDVLEPKKDDTAYNYTKDLATLEELWLEKLQPYGDRGYNKIKVRKQ
ncbi:MAG: metalloregulator ArsR/SmtB family transcription factor [Clostridiales bacterium]